MPNEGMPVEAVLALGASLFILDQLREAYFLLRMTVGRVIGFK